MTELSMRTWFDGIIKAKLFTFTKTLMIFQDLIIHFFQQVVFVNVCSYMCTHAME